MAFKKGYTPWNKGKTKKDDPRIAKLANCDGRRLSQFWFVKGQPVWNKGIKTSEVKPSMGHHTPHTEETKRKISLNRRGKAMGEFNGWWKGGGKRTKRHIEMGRWQYIEWRKLVFERDDYTCQICTKRGGNLNADHIKPWELYPELRYNVSNGRTICVKCHRKTSTWGARIFKYKNNLDENLNKGGGEKIGRLLII